MSFPSLVNFNRTPVTLILAAVAVALELVSSFDPERRLFYYNEAQLGIWMQIWQGQVWRPFTTTLMHGDVLHLLMNMMALFYFAPVLEHRLGSWRMLGLVVLLGSTSSLVQYVVGSYLADEQVAMVGMSGILFGLAGVLLVGRQVDPEMRQIFTPQVMRMMAGWFVLCVVLSQFGLFRVGNLAHGSGFVFGVLYGLALYAPRHRMAWVGVAAICTLLVLGTMIAAPGHPIYEAVKATRQA